VEEQVSPFASVDEPEALGGDLLNCAFCHAKPFLQ
jgi:hypothetical protein